MKTRKNIIRTIAFLLILSMAIWNVPRSLLRIDASGDYFKVKGFYLEKRDVLDAVFIGASNVHAFWQPAIGWFNHGIAVLNLSINGIPIASNRYLIAEARKTQPNALYIINLNSFKSDKAIVKGANYHRTVDFMPDTLEKLQFIHYLGEQSRLSVKEQLELLFPFIRFHSRWDKLKSWSYGIGQKRYKGSKTQNTAVKKVRDISD